MQDSLVQRLRDRAFSDPLMEEAANEIERLRGYRDMAEADRDVAMLAAERLRLTDEEREALHWFAHYGLPEHRAATLRSLLERLA